MSEKMNIAQLKEKFLGEKEDAEQAYQALVLEAVSNGITPEEYQRRSPVVERSGRTIGNLIADVELAEKLFSALRLLDSTDARAVEDNFFKADKALKNFKSEIEPRLKEELDSLRKRVARQHNEARAARQKYASAKAQKVEARRQNKGLAKLVEDHYIKLKKEAHE